MQETVVVGTPRQELVISDDDDFEAKVCEKKQSQKNTQEVVTKTLMTHQFTHFKVASIGICKNFQLKV